MIQGLVFSEIGNFPSKFEYYQQFTNEPTLYRVK